MAIPPDDDENLRRLFAQRESKMLGQTYAGLEFDSYLTGPSGCAVVLFIHDDTPARIRTESCGPMPES
jgi:hypothetical protein